MRTSSFLIALVLPLLLPPFAGAEELQFRLLSETEYNSSVLADTDDGITRFRPGINLQRNDHPISYELDYQLGYNFHYTESDLSDFEHRFRADVAYAPDRYSTLFMSNFLRVVPNPFQISVEQFDDEGDVLGTDVEVGTGETLSNVFSLGGSRQLTERSTLSAQYGFFVFDRENGQDTESHSISTSTNYRWDASHSFGASFTYRDTSSELDGVDLTDVTTLQLQGIWNWEIDSRTVLSASVGPALTMSDRPSIDRGATVPAGFPVAPGTQTLVDLDTCPLVQVGAESLPYLDADCEPFNQPGGVFFGPEGPDVGFIVPGTDFSDPDDSSLTFFGNVSLERRFQRGSLRFTWSRTDSQTQQVGGGTTVVNTFRGTAAWDITANTRLRFGVAYVRREALGESVATVFLLERGTTVNFDVDVAPGVTVTVPIQRSQVSGLTTLRENRDNRQDTWDVSLNLDHKLSSSMELYANAGFRDQSSVGDVSFGRDFNRYRFSLGVRYFFKPIRF